MTTVNKIKLSGELKETVYSHTVAGERFMKANMLCSRKSGTIDIVPVIIPEVILLCGVSGLKQVTAEGEVRTYTERVDDKKVKHLGVFVKSISAYEKKDANCAELTGRLAEKPTLRPLKGGNQICSFKLNVSGLYGKNFRIPCIAFGRLALKVSCMNEDQKIHIKARFQSRTYTKRYEDGTQEQKMTYELACWFLDEYEAWKCLNTGGTLKEFRRGGYPK